MEASLPTEFDDSAHWGFFMTGTTLTSQTGKYARLSELVLAGLRAQGVLDQMEDGIVAPATTKLWLDKNFDPAVLKRWDGSSAWVPVTFTTLFATAAEGDLAATAVQPGDLAAVATSGDYDDLSNTPAFGTAAFSDDGDFATAAQGTTADSAVQSIVAGTNVSVDATDPQNPVVSVSGVGTGDVVGPASAVTARIATFDGTTGKLIQDGGATIASVQDINGLTGKTTPVDADEMRIADSAASFGLKKLTFANLWAWAQAKILTLFNASGAAPVYACRAWVNFNGTGTVAIRASGNVSSITDNGTGDYTVNLTTAMSDADYAVVITASQANTGSNLQTASILAGAPQTSSAFRFRTQQENVGTTDSTYVCAAIFR